MVGINPVSGLNAAARQVVPVQPVQIQQQPQPGGDQAGAEKYTSDEERRPKDIIGEARDKISERDGWEGAPSRPTEPPKDRLKPGEWQGRPRAASAPSSYGPENRNISPKLAEGQRGLHGYNYEAHGALDAKLA